MRLLIVFIALTTLVVAAYVLIERQDARELRQPWPMGLAPLDSLQQRFPPESDNAAATHLIGLAAPLGIDFHYRAHPKQPISDAISAYVGAQVTRADDDVDPPPPDVAEFLHQHDTDLTAIRAHLLANRITWRMDLGQGADSPIPNLLAHLRLTRCLIARALRAHDTEDLHAAWLFARDLWRRPEEITRLIALAETGMIDAAMRKLPAAPWREEVRAFDVRRAMIESFEADTWIMHEEWREFLPTATNYASVMRQASAELAAPGNCVVSADASERWVKRIPAWNVPGRIAVPNLSSIWVRTERLVAQREATDRILAIKSGRWRPDLERSGCSDGHWIYMDGQLRFSREIPPPQRGLNVPLSYARERRGN